MKENYIKTELMRPKKECELRNMSKQEYKIGNCLDLLKYIPNASIDLLITDPPYNNGQFNGGGWVYEKQCKQGKYFDKIKENNLNKFNHLPFFEAITPKLKSFNAYIFCNKEMIKDYIIYFDSMKYNWNILIMGKNNPMPAKNNTYLPDKEYCFFIREKASTYFNNDLPFDYYRSIKMVDIGNSETEHPTEKKVWLIKQFIEISSKKNDTIIDPFLGSGTTLRACRETDRNCIGFEINPKYEQMIKKRAMIEQNALREWF